MKDFPLLLLPAPRPCIRDRGVLHTAEATLTCSPKSLVP